MKGDRKLRERLTALLQPGTTVGEFDAMLVALREEHPHAIEPEPGLVTGTTCIPYALNLHRNKTYLAVAAHSKSQHANGAREKDDVFASPEFVGWLIANGHLSVRSKEDAPPRSTLVIYTDDEGLPTHAGILREDGRIQSKWGKWPVYFHRAWEVPTIYGDEIHYFRRPGEEEILALFLEYARSMRLTDAELQQLLPK